VTDNPWSIQERFAFQHRRYTIQSLRLNGILAIVMVGWETYWMWFSITSGSGLWWLTLIVAVMIVGLWCFMTWRSWRRFLRADAEWEQMKALEEEHRRLHD